MKSGKRILAVILVLVMAVTMLALPVAASGATWAGYFRNFRMTSRYNYIAGYASAVQSILMGYDSTSDMISESGGVDGMFGASTAEAVAMFQRDHGLDDDEIVGPDTWEAMARYMSGGGYTLYSGNRKAIQITSGSSLYKFHYYTTSGSTYSATPFHTANA